MDERIYTEKKMLVGVFIGGSLAGAYYFWRTFSAFGKAKQGFVAIVLALVVFAVTLISIVVPFLDRIPNVVFWGIQIGLTLGVTRGYLLEAIARHVDEGKPVYSWGNTILVGVVSMVLTLGPLIGLAFLTTEPSTTRNFGRLNHEIVFDPSNISEVDVERIAAGLTSVGFFDEEVPKTVDAAASGDRFIITIYCNDEARDSEAIEAMRMLRTDLQACFPTNPVVIDMVVGTPDNRIARLE